MTKHLRAAALLLAALAALLWQTPQASAGITCALPFNLQNGQRALADQVMANFNALATCFAGTAAAGVNNDITALDALTTPILNGQLYPMAANTEKCNSTGSLGSPQDCGRPWVVLTDPSIGAKCDGVTDDTAALQAWASGIVAGGRYVIPNSSCLFKGPLTFTSGLANVTISGAGKQSQLLYAGTATTGTIVQIGVAGIIGCGGGANGWLLENFRVMSTTVMTGGVGLLIGHMCDSDIVNLEVGGDLNGNRNWFNAIQFYGGNTVHLRGYNFAASNIAETISGDTTNQFTDMFQSQGEISHSAIGLNIAGNVGGFNVDQTDILLSGVNVQVDQSQVALPNKQIFFGPLVDIDATSGGIGVGLNIIDAGSSPGSSIINLQGTWLASAATSGGGHGYCVWIQSTAINWNINFNNNPVINCQGEGIHNDSTSAIVNINSPHIDYNVGMGVDSTVSNPTLALNNPYCGTHGQAGGCFSANVNQNLVGGVNGATQGKLTLYGSTSGSSFMQANSTGALQLGNNVGGLNTFFVDGTNGTSLIIGNAAGGTIANQYSVIPSQAGSSPNIAASGTDTNINARITPKGTGKFTVGGTAPTLTAGCNGSGQAISGNDTHGTITGQTTVSTSCTLTFSAAYTATPDCVVTGLSSPLTGAVTVSTSTLVVNFASTANYKWSYHCLGN